MCVATIDPVPQGTSIRKKKEKETFLVSSLVPMIHIDPIGQSLTTYMLSKSSPFHCTQCPRVVVTLFPLSLKLYRELGESQDKAKVDREDLSMELEVGRVVLQADKEDAEKSSQRLVICKFDVPFHVIVHELAKQQHHFLDVRDVKGRLESSS
jgi:hypothetical protein